MKDHDTLQRFLFEEADVRGEIVRLQESFKAIIELHKYLHLSQAFASRSYRTQSDNCRAQKECGVEGTFAAGGKEYALERDGQLRENK